MSNFVGNKTKGILLQAFYKSWMSCGGGGSLKGETEIALFTSTRQCAECFLPLSKTLLKVKDTFEGKDTLKDQGHT